MRMCLRRILLIAALLPFLCGKAAASDDFLIQHFEPTLSSFNSTVNALMQDSMGFIWMGTDNGLFRYDGHNLLQVDLPSIRSGHRKVRSICEDPSGDIWIGTNGGLVHYLRRSGSTELFWPEDPTFTSVAKVIALPSGDIALGVRNHGAWILDPATGQCQRIEDPEGTVDETLCICLGDDETLYILSPSHGLLQADLSRSLRAERVETVAENPFHGVVLYNIEHYDGRILAGAADKTCIMDLRSGEISWRSWSVVHNVIPIDQEGGFYLASNRGLMQIGSQVETSPLVNGYHIDQEGGFYLASNRGLMQIGPDMQVVRVWDEDFDDPYALHDKSIRCLCRDREGNLWAGTSYSGAYILEKNFADMERFYPSSPGSPYGRRIREIVEDEDGILWIGSENSGLMRYDLSSGAITRVPLPIRTLNILGLCVDGPYLWIGSYSRRDPTIRLERRTMRTKAFPKLPYGVSYIYKGEGNTLFLSDDHALYVYDTAADSVRLMESIAPADFQYTTGIHGKGGELWMGGAGARLNRYHNGVVTPITDIIIEEGKDNSVYAQRNVHPRLVDSEGNLWFSIRDVGLFRMNVGDGAVRRFDYSRGGGITSIRKVLEDSDGIIWIVSNRSLVTLDPASGEFFTYDRDDGLLSGEFNEASGLIASDGKLYTGLMDGMVAFDPLKFRKYPIETQRPVFAGVELMHSPKDRPVSDSLYLAPFAGEGRITLKATQNAFTVSVSEMSYSIPHRAKLVYSLDEGRHWKEVVGGKIEVSRLPAGRYNLKVRSKMSDGTLDAKESVLKIRILAPVLLSVPFILLYIVLFVLLLMLVREVSIRKTAEKAKLDAELREAERQKELWSSKMDFLTAVAHEIRNPLALVKAPVESLRLRLGKSADATVVKEIETVSNNADKLSSMLDSLMNVHGQKDYQAPGVETASAEPAQAPTVTVPGSGKRVLIVERDREIMAFLCARLEDAYTLYRARSISEAEEILQEHVPDIIVCDIDAGTTDYYAFCSRLKSGPETAPVPLVIISDIPGSDAKVSALSRGAEAYFPKPFSIVELMGAMGSILQNRDRVRASLAERPAIVADKDFLANIERIMKARMSDETLTVDSLAEEACVSSSGLFKRLKALTGMSPGEYITASRMKEAASLMKNTALSIDDISIKVGFRSHSYFSTCFKHRFGMSPKKYRQLSEL